MDRRKTLPFLICHGASSQRQALTATQTSGLQERLTHDEVLILKRGETKRIAEILPKSGSRAWIYELSKSIERGDGSMVRSMFKSLQQWDIIFNLVDAKYSDWIYGLKSNAGMCFIIMELLRTFVTKRHEKGIKTLFKNMISFNCCLVPLDMIDDVWFKSCGEISNEYIFLKVKEFHQEIMLENGQEIDKFMIGTHVIQTGISRHIDVYLENGPEVLDKLLENPCTRLKLQRYACLTLSPIGNQILKNVETSKLVDLKQWYGEIAVASSAVPLSRSLMTAQPTEPNSLSNMARIVNKLDQLYVTEEAHDVRQAIEWLFDVCGHEVGRRKKVLEFTPILVGSAKERTQTLFPDEFDFLLHFINIGKKPLHQDMALSYLKDTLGKALRALQNHPEKDKRLVIEGFRLLMGRKYPCLHIAWSGEIFMDMEISIDLVPVSTHSIPAWKTLKHTDHSFLSDSHHVDTLHEMSENKSNIPEVDDLGKHANQKERTHHICSFNVYRMIKHKSSLALSELENHIILSVPESVREGYRLAKALRTSDILYPVSKELISLGITDNIHNIVRSYMLKTCVLYLTYDHTKFQLSNDRTVWAICIYSLMKKCLIRGKMVEYFQRGHRLFSCSDKNYTELRFFCCRKRKAMMLIVDRILQVLQEWFELEHDTKDITRENDTNPTKTIADASVAIAEGAATSCSFVDSTRSGFIDDTNRMSQREEKQRLRNYSHEFLEEFEHLQPAPFYQESDNGICPKFYKALKNHLDSVKTLELLG